MSNFDAVQARKDLDKTFENFISDFEKESGITFGEDYKKMLRLAFNEGWITATKQVIPMLKEGLKVTEKLNRIIG